jgi:hypothetical protein
VIEFETLQEAGPAVGTASAAPSATITVTGSTAALQPAASASAIR